MQNESSSPKSNMNLYENTGFMRDLQVGGGMIGLEIAGIVMLSSGNPIISGIIGLASVWLLNRGRQNNKKEKKLERGEYIPSRGPRRLLRP